MKEVLGATGYVCPTAGGREVLNPLKVADSFRIRALGLMGRADIPADWGAGLFFPHCSTLHTCFMRFPLDVLFLGADMQPVGVQRDIPPWRAVKGPGGTVHCLEVRGGSLPEVIPAGLVWR